MAYEALPDDAFWRLCREDPHHHYASIYRPKFQLKPGEKIATAGSCFAQHFGARVKASNLTFLDVETKPKIMPDDVARKFGYGIYSARYGNLYTARQLRQLLDDSRNGKMRPSAMWEQDGRWYDGLRPQVEPSGYNDQEELTVHRKYHLARVQEMFRKADVFVFTLGLTEAWQDRQSGTAFPTAPGVVAGRLDPARHEFVNFGISDVIADLTHVVKRLMRMNRTLRVLLTVSPVPLTATASGQHIVQATTYSKSVLRVAAAEIAQRFSHVDYVPSYEIITNPMTGARFYNANRRTVTQEGVDTVMAAFFGAHANVSAADAQMTAEAQIAEPAEDEDDDLICEEVLLEGFARS